MQTVFPFRGKKNQIKSSSGWCFIPPSLFLFLQVLQKMTKAPTLHLWAMHCWPPTHKSGPQSVDLQETGRWAKPLTYLICHVWVMCCLFGGTNTSLFSNLVFIRFPCSVFNGNYAATKQPFNIHKIICSLPAVERRYQPFLFRIRRPRLLRELFPPVSCVEREKQTRGALISKRQM